MLGKLARWLVLLGYDAAYAGADGRKDALLMEEARREGRIFLTRDARIPEVSGVRKLVLREPGLEGQLLEVLRALGLKPERARLFSRCTWCNRELEALSREEALPLVPPMVRGLKTGFWRCPACRRLYWNGTHTERTISRLERLGL